MQSCLLCHRPSFPLHKLQDGRLCLHCFHKIPSCLRSCLKSMDSASLFEILSRKLDFVPTAHYGKIQIDENRGTVSVSGFIFSVSEIDSIELFCTSPEVRAGNVRCNVKFGFRIDSLSISCEIFAKRSVVCNYTRIDKTHVAWDEPGDLSMFRNMINRMIKRAQEQYYERNTTYFQDKHNIEVWKAMSVLLLDEGYTEAELKQNRNILMKAFHPDTGLSEEKYAKKINDAYRLLKEKL